MKKGIIGKKIGMTQIFDEKGNVVPVTVIEAGPCVVTQVKTQENDGYSAVQVGYVDKREKLVNKPVKSNLAVVILPASALSRRLGSRKWLTFQQMS